MISLAAIFDRFMKSFVNKCLNIKQMCELILPDI